MPIGTTLLKLLVTVWIVGQPPTTELLPREYPANKLEQCVKDAKALIATAREGVKAEAECVPAPTRAL